MQCPHQNKLTNTDYAINNHTHQVKRRTLVLSAQLMNSERATTSNPRPAIFFSRNLLASRRYIPILCTPQFIGCPNPGTSRVDLLIDGADRFAPDATPRGGRLPDRGGRLPSPALAVLPPGLRLLQAAGRPQGVHGDAQRRE